MKSYFNSLDLYVTNSSNEFQLGIGHYLSLGAGGGDQITFKMVRVILITNNIMIVKGGLIMIENNIYN